MDRPAQRNDNKHGVLLPKKHCEICAMWEVHEEIILKIDRMLYNKKRKQQGSYGAR